VYDSSITWTVSMLTFLMSCFLQIFFHPILAYLTAFLWCASCQTQNWWNTSLSVQLLHCRGSSVNYTV
jgi:hypothetical protein